MTCDLQCERFETFGGRIRDQLDHKYLNEVPGLEKPTLENICAWIWDRVQPDLPELVRVTVRRGSFREACTYTGPDA